MDAEYFRTLFDYGYWARDRLFAAMDGITEEEYAQPNGFNYGSIRGILTHCLDGEYGWRCQLDGEPDAGNLRPEELPTVSSLAERWAKEEAKMRAYLARLTDVDIVGNVMLTRRDGSTVARALWKILAHVANHSTQHRSEAAEALTMTRRSPGDLDLMFYFRERAS